MASYSTYDLLQEYVDAKWPQAATKSRSGIADALATATFALLKPSSKQPHPRVIRIALAGWTFNTKRRSSSMPYDIELTPKLA